MLFGSLMAAALLFPASENADADAVQAKIHAAQEAYHSCIFTQAAQMYRGKDDKRLEQRIGESCNGAFDSWLDAMTTDGISEEKEAARDAMQPMLRVAIHTAVLAEVEARRGGRPTPPSSAS